MFAWPSDAHATWKSVCGLSVALLTKDLAMTFPEDPAHAVPHDRLAFGVRRSAFGVRRSAHGARRTLDGG
jgi:hypothetical protein